MAQEVLSVKLSELQEQLAQLSSRIHRGEIEGHAQRQREIQALTRECAAMRDALQTRLRRSRAAAVSAIADAYEQVERIIEATKAALQGYAFAEDSMENGTEEKILLAEYALDFAVQAASQALLLALEAIDAQHTQQEQERRLS